MKTQIDLLNDAYTAGHLAAIQGRERTHPYNDFKQSGGIQMAAMQMQAREWIRGYDDVNGNLQGYRDAWYEVAKFLDIPAMAISPAQVHESVLMPKLRELRERNAELQRALAKTVNVETVTRVANEMQTCAHTFTEPTRKSVDVWAHDLFDAIGSTP